jgi:type I restriction enzyme S subunit
MEVVKANYKVINGVVPDGWEVKTLGDVVDKIIGGGTPSRTNRLYWGKEIPWATVKDFATFNPSYTQEYITKIGLENSASNLVPKNTLITSTRMGLGKAVIYKVDVSINQDLKALIPSKCITTEYLYHWFKNSSDVIEKLGNGSTVMGISLNELKGIQFIQPPLKEQTAIATALADTDALISNMEKLIAKKRAIKQGAMQELLKPKKGWETKRLGEILKVKHGKDQKQVADNNGKFKILGTGGLMGYSNKFLYDKESVLIGRKGTIDKPRYICEPFWTVDTLFYTEISKDFSVKFIYYQFLLIDWYSYNEASGVPSLNAKTIESISISVPLNKSEQETIVSILSDMDAELESIETKLEKYRQIKSGMMQNLLTGKIRLV